MINGLKIISGFLFTAIILTQLPPLSLADTTILKNGQSIEADKIDEREEDIIFYVQGLKMRVSKAGVVRIVKANGTTLVLPTKTKKKAAENKTPSNNHVQAENTIKISPAPIQAPFGSQAAKKRVSNKNLRAPKKMKKNPQPSKKPAVTPSEKNLTEIRWCGLRDLRWGAGRSTLGRLQEIESGTGEREIKEFVRAKEDLKMGKTQLDSIIYALWRHRLYAVTIWVSGHDNYVALRNEVFNRFGVGLKSEKNTERYLWSDTYSDRMLKYIEANQTGLFWMRSKDLNRKYHLSQIKKPSTVLKAMEANALRAE